MSRVGRNVVDDSKAGGGKKAVIESDRKRGNYQHRISRSGNTTVKSGL